MAQILIPGTATADKVLSGQTFSAGTNYNAVGTMAINGAVTITPSTANQAIAAGYHNGSGIVQGDANLVAGNIRSGVSIFGVAGNVTTGSTGIASASGTVTSGTSYYNSLGQWGGAYDNSGGSPGASWALVTVGGLTFTPKRIVIAPATPRSSPYTTESTTYNADDNYVNTNPYTYRVTNGYFYSYTTLYAQMYAFPLGSTIYVNGTGFQMPVIDTNRQYHWYAYA